MEWSSDLAFEFLRERGWFLTSRWTWLRPMHQHVISLAEYAAIDYLCDEWDFAGIERN